MSIIFLNFCCSILLKPKVKNYLYTHYNKILVKTTDSSVGSKIARLFYLKKKRLKFI